MLSLLFFSTFAFSMQTKIVYFGGYRASGQQMACWESGARAKRPDLDFEAVSYPSGATASAASAVSVGASRIRDAVGEIDRNPERKFVVVGHSSGSALALEVAKRVKNPSQIRLVNLDGFSPSPGLQARVNSTCWYAVRPGTNLVSLNAGSVRARCAKSRGYRASRCQTKWCLHFSLVNTEVPVALTAATFATKGYDGCATNLSFLEPEVREPNLER